MGNASFDQGGAGFRELWERAQNTAGNRLNACRLLAEALDASLHSPAQCRAELLAALRQPFMPVRPDTGEVAIMRVKIDVERLALVKQ